MDITTLSAIEAEGLVHLKNRRVVTGVPFLDTDDFDRFHPSPLRGTYIVARIGRKIVGVRKYYEWEMERKHLNEWLQLNGLGTVTGRVYSNAYVAVHPSHRRQGIGTALNDTFFASIRPGDVVMGGTHEPDGLALNKHWFESHKDDVKVLIGPYFTGFNQYDPTLPNYFVKDIMVR